MKRILPVFLLAIVGVAAANFALLRRTAGFKASAAHFLAPTRAGEFLLALPLALAAHLVPALLCDRGPRFNYHAQQCVLEDHTVGSVVLNGRSKWRQRGRNAAGMPKLAGTYPGRTSVLASRFGARASSWLRMRHRCCRTLEFSARSATRPKPGDLRAGPGP